MGWRLGIVLGVLCGLLAGGVRAQGEHFIGRTPAPAFPAGLDWINVDAPLTLDGLRGKIVILDFWTYGCINCIHMVPVLAQVGERFADEVVIVSVHSAKFTNESHTDNIRQIVRRFGIRHPVVNDRDFAIWRSYGVNAWPTFVIIDPRGGIVAADAGELAFEVFETFLSAMIAFYDSAYPGELDRTPLPLALEGAGDPGTPLLFPGEVLADAAGGRLFISDTSHHRIVIADLNTFEVLAIIGGGRGRADGRFASARFNRPQGLALQGERLYIADTGNHQIRLADLTTQTVTTLAGNGQKALTLAVYGQEVGDLLRRPLRSPWGLAFGDNPAQLYIAMAGMHQIHRLDLTTMTQSAVVGSGYEGQHNASAGTSELAQPSGLFYARGELYFADSESSTLRAVNFALDQVRVVSGTLENSLFDYGDADGAVGVSRLQHALDVTGTPDGLRLFIADTYNHRIRQVDTLTMVTTTLAGAGAGFRDGAPTVARFDEPGGISYADGRLYVADTNNHAIRMIDTTTGVTATIHFPNVERLLLDRPVTVIGGNAAEGAVRVVEAVTLPPGEHDLTFELALPPGYRINPLAESTLTVRVLDSSVVQASADHAIHAARQTIPFTLREGRVDLTFELVLFYCEYENARVCLVDMTTFIQPLVIRVGAPPATWRIAHEVVLPERYRP